MSNKVITRADQIKLVGAARIKADELSRALEAVAKAGVVVHLKTYNHSDAGGPASVTRNPHALIVAAVVEERL